MQTVAIIPARGGSKGIPRKNLCYLGGLPLIAHSIQAARGAATINRVIVSTDDAEIAAVARRYQAEVVIRPPELAGDTSSSEAALLHALEYLEATEGYTPEVLVFLQCTSPLTLSEDIDGTVRTMLDAQADTALTVVPFHHFLWSDASPEGAIGLNHDKRVRLRRQDMEPQFLETGAVYVMRCQAFKQVKHRFFGKTVTYLMPRERYVDIDDPVDFSIAEVMLRERTVQQQVELLPEPIGALVLDFDGVFTDNRVMVLQDGREAVLCSRSDGMGLAHFKRLGIPVVVISSETNPVVEARCHKLGIPVIQGVQEKLSILRGWAADRKINLDHVVYVGNDVNDISCMQAVGCSIVVNDCHPEVLPYARIVLSTGGGQGAIREVISLISHAVKGCR